MTPNRYTVAVMHDEAGWRVAIADPGGREVFERACSGEPEARAFASTVEQHRDWLSEERFRRYYRLPEEA